MSDVALYLDPDDPCEFCGIINRDHHMLRCGLKREPIATILDEVTPITDDQMLSIAERAQTLRIMGDMAASDYTKRLLARWSQAMPMELGYLKSLREPSEQERRRMLYGEWSAESVDPESEPPKPQDRWGYLEI